ncbi:MAG TPA: flagellar hook-basal body complex protein, partial [Deferrisomatales bacterium]|nr:flagellar hook-basal body complex protein [Deferrisomatales bacterium]
ANVNTTGYKSSRTTFMDTLSQTVSGARAGNASTGGQNAMQVGLGMTVAAIDRDMNQGALQSTGRTLDMAIEGEGWFVVGETNPLSGTDTYYYTRAGSFFVDDQANLVSSNGDMLYGWVDTDSSGSIDASRDEMGFINLDRRGDGAITNALASSTPPISGPNLGDASISDISTLTTTASDTWRVENINAEQGWFRVSGARSGVIGTFAYDTPVNDSRLGNFNIAMNPPAQARLVTPFASGDGIDEVLTFTDPGAAGDQTITFVSGVTASGGVEVSTLGSTTTVTLNTDADGVVVSTFEDVVGALTGLPYTASFAGTPNSAANALVNRVVSVNAGAPTDFSLGDVGPGGVLGWTANEFGAGANDLNITLVNRGAQQIQTEVVVDGASITVYLKANSAGAVSATAQEVYDAFGRSPEALALVTMDAPSAADADLVVEPFTQVFFSDGAGANLGDYFTFTTTAPGGANLQSISVNREGGVIGVFENGTTEELARVALAKPPNPQGLLAVGQGKFVESPVSGSGFPPVAAGTGGTGGIASGFLEMSNVDLTREFTDMIVNQRGFQANSRIITTSDEMLQELLALKR